MSVYVFIYPVPANANVNRRFDVRWHKKHQMISDSEWATGEKLIVVHFKLQSARSYLQEDNKIMKNKPAFYEKLRNTDVWNVNELHKSLEK